MNDPKNRIRFLTRIKIENPLVIKRRKMVSVEDYAFDPVQLVGPYYRLTPTNAREIFFISTLEKYTDKWAPFKGNGIIVRASIIDNMFNNRK